MAQEVVRIGETKLDLKRAVTLTLQKRGLPFEILNPDQLFGVHVDLPSQLRNPDNFVTRAEINPDLVVRARTRITSEHDTWLTKATLETSAMYNLELGLVEVWILRRVANEEHYGIDCRLWVDGDGQVQWWDEIGGGGGGFRGENANASMLDLHGRIMEEIQALKAPTLQNS